MGRKREREIGPVDRLGEEINLEKCPQCPDHPDCFACIEGRCTALKESGGEGCIFYKPTETAIAENKQIYQHLKEIGRHDLIVKYIKTETKLGMLNAEMEAAAYQSKQLQAFEASDFEEAVRDAGLVTLMQNGEEHADGTDDTGWVAME